MRALLAGILGLALLVTPAGATFRSPQVPISGTGLQSLLGAQGQTLDVTTDQQYPVQFDGLGVAPSFFATIFMQSIGTPTLPLALYSQYDPSPEPAHVVVAPTGMLAGWRAVASYGQSPYGLVVSLFDETGALQATTTIPNAPVSGLLFALVSPTGLLFPVDARNAGQQPRLLFYQGTGAHAYDIWICGETDGDSDFDDAVYLVENFSLTPVRPTTWGALKARFR